MTVRQETAAAGRVELGEAIRAIREQFGWTIRELGRRSNVSAAQISRIEAGGVKPEQETLLSLAIALKRHVWPLFVLAGHAQGNEARWLLADLLLKGSTASVAWASEDPQEFAEAKDKLAQDDLSDHELRRIARKMFSFTSDEAKQRLDSWLGPVIAQEAGEEASELVRSWLRLPKERQKKVLDYVRDQQQLADAEGAAASSRRERRRPR